LAGLGCFLEINALFDVLLTIGSLALPAGRPTHTHTHMGTLRSIFPVEMLGSFIATLSKRNLANGGCIEQVSFL